MIKIGLVDDHAVTRNGLRELLESHDGLQVIAEGRTGNDALELSRNMELDVLIMDLDMPHRSGADVIKSIKARARKLDVVILSGLPEEHYAVKMIREGAAAYLSKQGDPSEIVAAVRTVSEGRRYLTPQVAELLAAHLDPARGDPHLRLSEREFQVFTKLAGGMSTARICQELKMTPKTVSSNRLRIFAKMGVKTTSELTYYSVKNGLIY